MTVGERIKQKRIEMGLSQEELAFKCGYKSRSSVNKIELSRDLPLKKIELMAKALDVEPSFLMGWEDEEPDSDMVLIADYILNPNEDITTLLTIAGKLSEDNLHKVIDIAEALLLTQPDNEN